MCNKEILVRKKELILENYLSEEELKNIKHSKFLPLLIEEINSLEKFHTKKEIHLLINSIFEKNISAPLFYRFCSMYLKPSITEKRNTTETKTINQENQNNVNNVDDLTSNTLDFLSKNLPKK